MILNSIQAKTVTVNVTGDKDKKILVKVSDDGYHEKFHDMNPVK